MLSRNNFRVALYKLILLKNIVDTKIHKERIQMLYAFEQLIINTEDMQEGMYGDEEDGTKFIEVNSVEGRAKIEELIANETDPYMR